MPHLSHNPTPQRGKKQTSPGQRPGSFDNSVTLPPFSLLAPRGEGRCRSSRRSRPKKIPRLAHLPLKSRLSSSLSLLPSVQGLFAPGRISHEIPSMCSPSWKLKNRLPVRCLAHLPLKSQLSPSLPSFASVQGSFAPRRISHEISVNELALMEIEESPAHSVPFPSPAQVSALPFVLSVSFCSRLVRLVRSAGSLTEREPTKPQPGNVGRGSTRHKLTRAPPPAPGGPMVAVTSCGDTSRTVTRKTPILNQAW